LTNRFKLADVLPGLWRNLEFKSIATLFQNLAEEPAGGKCMSFAERENVNARIASFSGGGQLGSGNPIEVLEELFELLEDYGPAWYTQKVHDRAVAALISARCSGRSSK
jgi:hypothetical protein